MKRKKKENRSFSFFFFERDIVPLKTEKRESVCRMNEVAQVGKVQQEYIQGVPEITSQKFFRISLLSHSTLSTIFLKIKDECTEFLFIRTTFHTKLQNYNLRPKYKNFAFFVRCE